MEKGSMIQVFKNMIAAFAKTPVWVPLILFPALAVAAAVLFTVFGKRKWYPISAASLVAAGFVLLYAIDSASSFAYLGLFVLLVVLLALLFLIRPVFKERNADDTAIDEMYEKFREELTEKPFNADEKPPKVCCFEGEEGVTAEESGVRFGYADDLLKRLRAAKLTASDRLETDALARTLDGYRKKPLTDAERSSLNDCLAGILRLTAKYSL